MGALKQHSLSENKDDQLVSHNAEPFQKSIPLYTSYTHIRTEVDLQHWDWIVPHNIEN